MPRIPRVSVSIPLVWELLVDGPRKASRRFWQRVAERDPKPLTREQLLEREAREKVNRAIDRLLERSGCRKR